MLYAIRMYADSPRSLSTRLVWQMICANRLKLFYLSKVPLFDGRTTVNLFETKRKHSVSRVKNHFQRICCIFAFDFRALVQLRAIAMDTNVMV